MGTVIAIAVPLVLLAVVVALGKGGRRTAPLVVIALAWGVGSTWLLVHVNGWWVDTFSLTSLYVVGAPIVEELGKSLFSPMFTASRRSSWFVDGAVIGLAAGTGFAIRENLVYLERYSSDAIDVAFARVSSTNLMHAGCSAIVGAALALGVRRRRVTRLLVAIAGLVVAMGIHSGFNRLTRVSVPSPFVITVVGVAAFLLATFAVASGIPLSARWARSDMLARGLSAAESSVLAGGSSVEDVLGDFRSRFGELAAHDADRLIALQRRIGVLSRGGTSADRAIPALTAEADELRRRIGVFPMLWLRSYLPVSPLEVGVWAHLGASVTSASPSSSAPTGLWASLDQATATESSSD